MVSLKAPKLNPVIYILLVASIIIVAAILTEPTLSITANKCSTCHGSDYNQQLDIMEGSSQNTIPTTLQVGQTQTVKITLENINNAPRYNQFSNVKATLSSQNGHFSVNTPTVNIGTLSTTAIATWQITGQSQGPDTLLISVSAENNHYFLKYIDNYSPNPTITVTNDPNFTPTPTTDLTPEPTINPSPNPIGTPTTTPLPTSHPTNSPTSQNTLQPSESSSFSPTETPKSTPIAPNPTSPQQLSSSPTSPTQIDTLNSQTLYLLAPVAIGSILILAFAVLILTKKYRAKIR